jgi:hypothetical protein
MSYQALKDCMGQLYVMWQLVPSPPCTAPSSLPLAQTVLLCPPLRPLLLPVRNPLEPPAEHQQQPQGDTLHGQWHWADG